MSNVIHVTEADFEQVVLKSEKPVIVDFWATWCGPCKMIAPILDTLSEERKDILIVKVDVDENKELAKKYGIRSIPTMNLFIKGQLESSKVGAVTKSSLQSWIDMNT